MSQSGGHMAQYPIPLEVPAQRVRLSLQSEFVVQRPGCSSQRAARLALCAGASAAAVQTSPSGQTLRQRSPG
jgi:hypothetical protein